METKELKVYQTMEEFLSDYDYPSWKEKEPDKTLGSRHVMLTAAAQSKHFVHGLGRMSYFTTVPANKQELPEDEVMYELNTDYVLVLKGMEMYNEKTELLKVDGHDNAYIGLGSSIGEADRLVYDSDIILDNLIAQGMTEEEAQEYFNYNILDAYVGDKMPLYVSKVPLDSLEDHML